MRYILGIDPGLSGALALYDPMTETLATHPMPVIAAGTDSKRVLDELALARFIKEFASHIKQVFIERVHAMPKQGVTSVFSFGVGYGVIKGVIAANMLPVEYVTPQKWKKELRVPALKDGARARASEIFPAYADQWKLAKWDGRAESAMIAYYGARNLM